jgi:hypothetical protein
MYGYIAGDYFMQMSLAARDQDIDLAAQPRKSRGQHKHHPFCTSSLKRFYEDRNVRSLIGSPHQYLAHAISVTLGFSLHDRLIPAEREVVEFVEIAMSCMASA